METVDVGHGRGWADAPAAASIARIDTQLGRPLQITEAGRTYGSQWRLCRVRTWDGSAWRNTR